MKLSEVQNEEALDLLGDIIEPAVKIVSDPKIKEMRDSKETKMAFAKYILKEHKSEIIEILARLDGVPVEEYKCNVVTLPMKLLEILNDKELMSFFSTSASLE